MLKQLHIENYALIQELDIDFKADFSTLTGETGAGKSILLGALSLVLGSRADSSVLKNEAKKCIIEATFDIKQYNLKNTFEQLDFEYDIETIIRREINANGKSRAFVNDSPVNISNLKILANLLVDVHSQHKNLELNNSNFQMLVVDSISGNSNNLLEYKEKYKQYKKQEAELIEIKEEAKKAAEDYEYNLFQYNQLCEDNFEGIILKELESELETLNNAEEIQRALNNTFNLLSEADNNAIDLLKQSKQALSSCENFYPQAKEFNHRIESLFIELKDIASEIENESQKVEFNSEKAENLKAKLDKLYMLMQKHQVMNLDELLQVKNSFDKKIGKQESFDFEIKKLEQELIKTTTELKKIAENISLQRRNAFTPLAKKIMNHLKYLGMPHAVFNVKHEQIKTFTTDGIDKIEFLFSANKNHPPQNITKIASGGEISRLMLSIKCLMSESIALPTIIFDEIDTGVSGEIADKMAIMMQNMANNMQVISITHLPQIAAKGKTHYKVFKTENEHGVKTQIIQLNTKQRIDEIARMLSGKDITQQAIDNAKTLINIK